MTIALHLGWQPSEVRGLNAAEMEAAVKAATWRAGYAPTAELATATFEQLNHIYQLIWKLARAQSLIRRGAKEPPLIEAPRPYTKAEARAAERKRPNPNRRVMTPRQFAEAMRRGEFG